VVTSSADWAAGTRAEEHDLSGPDAPLRWHGGPDEQAVPFVGTCRSRRPRGPGNLDAWQAATFAPGQGRAAAAAPSGR